MLPKPGSDAVPHALDSELLARAGAMLASEVARFRAGLGDLPPASAPGSSTQPLGEWLAQPGAVDLTGLLGQLAPGELQRRVLELVSAAFSVVATGQRDAADQGAGRVPLLWCAAAVQAGETARATISVTSDESEPARVSLYTSNFISDCGHEIPALACHATPRTALIEPRGETIFQLEIAVPQQTAAGTYSGLVQATHTRYVKAVLMLEVL